MSEHRRPQLAELHLSDPPERWAALGFRLDDGTTQIGAVRLRLASGERGITRWSIHGLAVPEDIDGLPTAAAQSPPEALTQRHPNAASAVDHVVVVTPDFDRTTAALERIGMALSRVRDGGGFRQGFRRIGPAILELVEAPSMPAGPARFWGLVIVVDDLGALADRLGPHLGEPKPAVQPGRQIATLRRSAELSTMLAFMTPEPERAEEGPRRTPAERAPDPER
jgi:hypothetical protein